MAYRVLLAPVADRQLRRLPRQEQARLIPKIYALADVPRPSGVKKLKGLVDTYRIRVGNYRVVYEIRDIGLVVLVFNIGRRNESTYK